MNPKADGRVLALFGPTGVGKTAVAVGVASALGVPVISCDSMQLYKGCPVLTNQPSAEARTRAPHRLVAAAEPTAEWTAMDYAEAARAEIDESIGGRGWAVVAGGTGLYLRAALAPLDAPPARDEAVRRELEEEAARAGSEALVRELEEADPEAARKIDPRNVRRLVRALEVVRLEGEGAWSGRDDLWQPEYRHPTTVFGLTMERELLYDRINERAHAMLREGAIEEVRRLRAGGGSAEGQDAAGPTGGGADAEYAEAAIGALANAIGYDLIAAYLDGELDFGELEMQLAAATRRYARRQLTWLRRIPGAVMIDVSQRTPADVAAEILERAGRGADEDSEDEGARQG